MARRDYRLRGTNLCVSEKGNHQIVKIFSSKISKIFQDHIQSCWCCKICAVLALSPGIRLYRKLAFIVVSVPRDNVCRVSLVRLPWRT